MFLKISTMKGVRQFGKQGKLIPRYVGPYEILSRVGKVAYRLALPPELDHVHDVFHVSQLKRYHFNSDHVLCHVSLDIEPNLKYKEQPVRILDSRTRAMQSKEVKLVKVLWSNQKT